MTILVIDTSGPVCGTAVMDEQGKILEREAFPTRTPADTVPPMLAWFRRFPVDGRPTDIVLYAMSVRFVLHTEQTHLRQIEVLDFVDILWIDAFDGHIDIRLTGKEPHITHHHVGQLNSVVGRTTNHTHF